jgi:transposase
MANRERLSKNYQSLKIATQELIRVDKSIGNELMKLNDAALKGILKSKVKVEKRMLQLINEDEELKKLFGLITSVKCVGDVLATELIVYTNGFTRMSSNSSPYTCA